MPVYEYVCKSCDHEFEREQRITEDPIKTCPACGARKAKRLISRTAFVLKGGGWYSDLYSSSKKSDAGKSDGGGKTDGGGAAAGGDAKPSAGSGKSEGKSKGSGGGGAAKGSKAA